jgi:hypothetical protein
VTLPNERTRAVLNTRAFMLKLLLPPSDGGYKRVPRDVRKAASRLLKHFPTEPDLEEAVQEAPRVFGPDPKLRRCEES